MRHQTLAAGLVLVLATGAALAQAADSGPVVQNSQALAAADQSGMTSSTISQQIQGQMTKAGYTDVTVVPASFMVRAKDKQGNAVAMVIGPDSFTEVTEVAPKPMTTPKTGTAAPAAKP